MTHELQAVGAAVRATADTAGSAVVGIGRGWGTGSGFVFARDRVLTSSRSLRREELILELGDGRQVSGRGLGHDGHGLAVVEADTGDIAPVRWPAEHSAPGIGTPVIALANPGGRGLRATHGFVSAAPRTLTTRRGHGISGAIEHTAPLPRGSAGGPLLDLEGNLLGVNAVRMGGGLILAIPADTALRGRVDALGAGKAPRQARLGVAVAPPKVARRLRAAVGLPPREGVLIRGVEDDSPAARAGLERGDLIVSAAGTPIDSVPALYEALAAAAEGGRLELSILRGADERSIPVELG